MDRLFRRSPRRWPCWGGWLLLLAVSAGCASVKARDAIVRNAFRDRRELREAEAIPAGPWTSVLAREGLLGLAHSDPATAASRLEDHLRDHPEIDGALALAELSYRAGLARQTTSPDEAMAWLRDAAALASLSIRDSDGSDVEE